MALKIITKPHLALEQEILFHNMHFKRKYSCAHYHYLRNLYSLYEGSVMTVTVQGYFRQILQLSSIHECPGICECPRSAENNPAR